MSPPAHQLEGLNESELLWTRRRDVLSAAAAFVAAGGVSAVQAQSLSNIVQITGDVLGNGLRLTNRDSVQSGDTVETGPGSTLVFVIGAAAFHLRQNTRLRVERGRSLNFVSMLRLLTGGVVSAWGRGGQRLVTTPTLTAGIRGTGVYTEVRADGRSYFCNCYGTVALQTRGESVLSQADYHQSFWGEVEPKGGRLITPAAALNHTDEELEFLARLVGERPRWQELGRKGVKDGRGYMDERPATAHPAAR